MIESISFSEEQGAFLKVALGAPWQLLQEFIKYVMECSLWNTTCSSFQMIGPEVTYSDCGSLSLTFSSEFTLVIGKPGKKVNTGDGVRNFNILTQIDSTHPDTIILSICEKVDEANKETARGLFAFRDAPINTWPQVNEGLKSIFQQLGAGIPADLLR